MTTPTTQGATTMTLPPCPIAGHDDAPAVVDLAAALRASVEAARARQRERDNEPCPKCGGDRLRTDFTSSGRCHAERADA